MKKEVIISLLMTQPVAFNALANIDYPGHTENIGDESEGWNTAGKPEFKDGKYIAPAGAQYTKTLEGLVQGKYRLSVKGGINVKIQVGENKSTENFIDFDYKTGDDAPEIKISAVSDNLNGFSFEGIILEIIFDQKSVANDLKKNLDGIKSMLSDKVAGTSLTQDLLNKKSEIEEKITDLNNRISDITSKDGEELVDVYRDEELYLYDRSGDKISFDLFNLESLIEEYNKAVDDLKIELDNQNANIAAYESAKQVISGLWTKFDAFYAKYTAEDASKYATGQTKKEHDAIEKALKDYEARLNLAFYGTEDKTDDSKIAIVPVDFQPNENETGIGSRIDVVSMAFDTYTNDDQAYEAVKVKFNELQSAYDKALIEITAVSGVVDEEKGVDYSDVYSQKQTKTKEAVKKCYDDASAGISTKFLDEGAEKTPENIGGCSGNKDNDIAILSEAITGIENAVSELQYLSEKQNELMGSALSKISELEELMTEEVEWLGKEKDHKFTTAIEEERQSHIKAYNDGIESLKSDIEEAYKKHELTADSYAGTNDNISAINGAIDALNGMKDVAGDMDGLYGEYTKIENAIKGYDEDIVSAIGSETVGNFSLYDIFNSELEAIKNKIEATVSATKDEIDSMKKNLADLQTEAKNIKDAIIKMNGDYSKVFKAIGSFEQNISNSLYLGNNKENYYTGKKFGTQSKSLSEWKGTKAKLQEEFISIFQSVSSGEVLLNKIEEISKKYDTEGEYGNYLTNINNDQKILLTHISEDNLDYAVAKKGEITADIKKFIQDNNLDADGLAGYGTDGNGAGYLSDIDAKINTIKAAITGATDENYVSVLPKQNEAIKNLIENDIKTRKEDAEKLTQNYRDYNSLNNLILEANSAINDTESYITSEVEFLTDQAKQHYTDLLDTLKSSFDGIKNKVEEAYQKGSQVDNASDKKADLEKQIGGVSSYAANMRTSIDYNNSGYKDMLAISQNVLNSINASKASLSDKGSDIVGKLNTVASDLNDLDVKALGYYNDGVYGDAKSNDSSDSAKNVSDLTDGYNALLDSIKEIMESVLDDYNLAIKASNDELKTSLWSPVKTDLWNCYDSAVADYQYYRDKLTNPSYRKALAEKIPSSAVMIDFYEQIRSLETDVDNYVQECNSVPEDKSRKDFISIDQHRFQEEGDFYIRAEEIMVAIGTKVSELEANAKETAETYYSQLVESIGMNITAATNDMTNAGVESSYQENVVNVVAEDLNTAFTMYQNGMDLDDAEGAERKSGLLAHRMDNIAYYLDQAKSQKIDTQKAAKDNWNNFYAVTYTELDGDLKSLDTYTSSDEEIRNAARKAIEEQMAIAVGINDEATKDANLIKADDNDEKILSSYISLIDECVKAVKDEVGKVKKSHDDNVENETIYDGYKEDYNNLKLRYDSLISFVGSLAAETECDQAESALDAFLKAVDKTYRSDLKDNGAEIDQLRGDAGRAISVAFEIAAQSEVDWLTGEIETVKVAFNDARTLGSMKDEQADTYKNSISEYTGNLEDIKAAINEAGTATGSEYDAAVINLQEPMSTLERALCDLEAELNGIAGKDNRAEGVISDLDELYDAVSEKIESGESFLGSEECNNRTKADYEQGKFSDDYDTLKSALDDIKAEYEADGNAVIAHSDNFRELLNEIDGKVEALAQEIVDSDIAYDADDIRLITNEQSFSAIKEEYTQLINAWTEARDRLAGYKYDHTVDLAVDEDGNPMLDEDGNKIYHYNYWFAQIKNDIESAYQQRVDDYDEGKGSLTSDDKLFADGTYEAKQTLINLDLSKGTITELDGWIKEAKASVANAKANVPALILPTVKASIEEELTNLQERADKLVKTYTNENNEEENWAPGHMDEADARLSEAESIIKEAAEQLSLAGENVYVPGDLNQDRIVDVADVQMLIDIIGNDFEGTAYEGSGEYMQMVADLNGNRMFEAGDIAGVVNVYVDANPFKSRAAMFAPAVEGENIIGLQLVSEENGVSRYAVEITNAATFVAGQMDITVPSGMSVVSVITADRTDALNLYRYDNAKGMRLILASMDNSAIEGNQGAVVYIDVTGRGRLDVNNVIFADRRGVSYRLDKDMSGIDSTLTDTLRNAKEAIYNVAGQAIDSLRRGFNIVRRSDGTSSKEYHK